MASAESALAAKSSVTLQELSETYMAAAVGGFQSLLLLLLYTLGPRQQIKRGSRQRERDAIHLPLC